MTSSAADPFLLELRCVLDGLMDVSQRIGGCALDGEKGVAALAGLEREREEGKRRLEGLLSKVGRVADGMAPLTHAPAIGSSYWGLIGSGPHPWKWSNCESDLHALSAGRCFATREAALAAYTERQTNPAKFNLYSQADTARALSYLNRVSGEDRSTLPPWADVGVLLDDADELPRGSSRKAREQAMKITG